MESSLQRHTAAPAAASVPGHDGAPLLLLHGLGGDRHSWRPVLAGLTAERDVLVAELPGFGAAAPLPYDIEPSPAALADAIAARLQDAGIDAVHVVGHSLGGWVALELADRAPERVRSVVALTPAGFWSRPLEEREGRAIRIGRRLSPVLPLLLAPRRVRDAVIVGAMGGPGGHAYRDALDVVRGYVHAKDYVRVNRAMRRRTFDVAGRLAPLAARVPVHVAWAEHDRLVTPPRRPLPPDVHVHVLPGAGHLPTFDVPDRIVALVLAAARDAEAPHGRTWDTGALDAGAPAAGA